jgi:hypothetical protein
MKHILILTFTTFLFSCKSGQNRSVIIQTPDFVLIDSMNGATDFVDPKFPETEYPIYYIGSKQDTVRIGRRYSRVRTPRPISNTPHSSSINVYSEKTLKLLVDTSVQLSSPEEYLTKDEGEIQGGDKLRNYNSFLVSIENKTDSVIYLGKSFSVFYIHREVKGANGAWIKLERSLVEYNICGTNEPDIMLKPRNILLSKLKRYSGADLCEFRLVFGFDKNVIYSNIFKDSFSLNYFK